MAPDVRRITLKYFGKCFVCGSFIPAGDQAIWTPGSKQARHVRCRAKRTNDWKPDAEKKPQPAPSPIRRATARVTTRCPACRELIEPGVTIKPYDEAAKRWRHAKCPKPQGDALDHRLPGGMT